MSEKTPTITINGQRLPDDAVSYELSRLVKFYSQHMPEQQLRAQLPILRERAVEQAIGSKLLFMEADRLEIQTPEEDVEKSVFEMAKQSGGMAKLREKLKKQNLTETVLREQIRLGRRVDLLVEKIVAGAPEPSEEDIKAHFDAHSEEYVKPQRVLAQHILISPKEKSDEAKKEAKDKLLAIRARVEAGADFGDEASAHSECPSGKNGGSLGWFSRGMMVPEFDKAAFEMNVGEVSDIVETQFGFHIIYKTDSEEAKAADFDEAHDSIAEFLRHTRRGEILSAHVAELRAKANVTIN